MRRFRVFVTVLPGMRGFNGDIPNFKELLIESFDDQDKALKRLTSLVGKTYAWDPEHISPTISVALVLAGRVEDAGK